VLELTDSSTGFGDVVVSAARSIWIGQDGNRLTWHTSLKLPTGDADRLHGSGAADLSFWLSGNKTDLVPAWRLGGFMQAGVLLMGEGEVLPALQQDHAWFGGVGTYWQALPWLTLKGQVDMHSAIYSSHLDQLGRTSYLLTLGGSISMDQDRGVIDLAIGENMFDDTVPDFMINLAYRYRY